MVPSWYLLAVHHVRSFLEKNNFHNIKIIFWRVHRPPRKQKKKPMSATLHVSGDGLRVVDKKNSGMLVDQVNLFGKFITLIPLAWDPLDRHVFYGFIFLSHIFFISTYYLCTLRWSRRCHSAHRTATVIRKGFNKIFLTKLYTYCLPVVSWIRIRSDPFHFGGFRSTDLETDLGSKDSC